MKTASGLPRAMAPKVKTAAPLEEPRRDAPVSHAEAAGSATVQEQAGQVHVFTPTTSKKLAQLLQPNRRLTWSRGVSGNVRVVARQECPLELGGDR